jgi:hypothetical protein
LVKNAKKFHVHKDVICHYSEYFRAAFNGRWIEAEEDVKLEDIDVEVFELFVHWLYAQELPRWKPIDHNQAAGLLLLKAVGWRLKSKRAPSGAWKARRMKYGVHAGRKMWQ